jgi:protein-disulfide isomerase
MREYCSAFLRLFTLALGVPLAANWLIPSSVAQSPSPTGHPVATVAGQAISEDELLSKIEPQLRQLRNQEYDVKVQALESLIEQRLLDAEASHRKVTVGELLRQEVDSKTPQPTDAEVEALYQAQKDRINQPLEQVKEQLQQLLRQSRAQQVRQSFLKTLRDQAGVAVFLAAPRIEVEADPGRLRGDPKAPITIVEFSDFQCPFCQRAYPTVQAVLAKYGDKIKISYRDFPLRGIHPQAQLAAVASRCAGAQGKFWEFHDDLFSKPNQLTADQLTEHATNVGLDSAEFRMCLQSGRYDESIERDLQDGMQAGVSGTPAFFINGVLLSGAQPPSAFERVIEAELAAHRQVAAPAPSN